MRTVKARPRARVMGEVAPDTSPEGATEGAAEAVTEAAAEAGKRTARRAANQAASRIPDAESRRLDARVKGRRDAAVIAELRARIRALERAGPEAHGHHGAHGHYGDGAAVAPGLFFGLPALDAHLPEGLRLAGLHEIAGAKEVWDDGAAAGFCLALLGRVLAARPRASAQGAGGVVLWAARRADLYAPGVAALGLDPGRLVLVRARRDAELLWVLEEGLRAPAFCALVGELGEADETAARRLQLAAESAGRPCFLLRRRLFAARGAGAAPPALSRWRVAALPSVPNGSKETEGAEASGRSACLPGRARWRVELLRCRGAMPGQFIVEWDHAAGAFALAAPVRDRAVAAPGAADQACRARAAG